MRIKMLILWLMTAAALTVQLPPKVCADSVSEREYQLKAAFLYNFVVFVDGARFDQLSGSPKAETPDPNKSIVIGILGKDPFGEAFAPLRNKEIRGRSVAVRRFKGFAELVDSEGGLAKPHPKLEEIKACHVLFVCSSEKTYVSVVLEAIGTHAILTVADTPGFLEAGGMINFLIEEKKVRFEINTAATTRAKLRIRSKLLRLAKRVVKRDAVSELNQEEYESQEDSR